MNKKQSSVALLMCALLFPSASVYSSDSTSTIKLLLGGKSLNSKWGSDDFMNSIGFLFTYQPMSLPIGLAIDFYGNGSESNSSGIETETIIGEVNFGIRWQPVIQSSAITPYLGAGISYAEAELEYIDSGIKRKSDDSAGGYWLGGGVDYIFAERWTFGIDARFSSVDVKLNGQDRDAGGFGLGIALGYRF